MNFRPLHDRVVVRRIESDQKTSGGIIIPDTAQEKPQEGQVVAVGPGGRDEAGKLIAPDLKAGDRILFGKWSGTEVKLDGQEYLIMKESDVLGVIDNVAPMRAVKTAPKPAKPPAAAVKAPAKPSKPPVAAARAPAKPSKPAARKR